MADGRVSVSSEAVSTEQRDFFSEKDIPDPAIYVSFHIHIYANSLCVAYPLTEVAVKTAIRPILEQTEKVNE